MIHKKLSILLFVMFTITTCQLSCAKGPHMIDQTISSRLLTFDQMKFSFAPAKYGSVFIHRFRFRNKGKTVSIIKVSTSCGCTVADYPIKPIPPGSYGIISVRYFSGKQPKGFFRKCVNILTTREIVRLQIEGTSN